MYIYVKKYGNKLYSTYYDKNDKKQYNVCTPNVEIFVPTQNKNTEFKVFPTNQYVEKMTFKTINDYKDFKNNMNNSLLYGNLGQLHNELYHIRNKKIYEHINTNIMKVFYIDIEVFSPNEFPQPNEAKHPISSLCVIDRATQKSVIWGCCNYKPHKNNIEYRYFECERDMLFNFCKYVGEEKPDIFLGWSAKWFDYPYIYNRLKNIFQNDYTVITKMLSPFNIATDKKYYNKKTNKTVNSMDIFGIQLLDLLDIYQKYTQENKRSYSLNNISQEELNMEKLDYSEEGTLTELYLTNPQKYVEYEYQDTLLLYLLEEKLGFMDRIIGVTHYARIPIEKYVSPVTTWEAMLFNELYDRKMVFPPTTQIGDDEDSESIEAAYVKDPIPGIYGWFASCDINSEYPHTIIHSNISPETKINSLIDQKTVEILRQITVQKLTNKEIDLTHFKDINVCVAANASIYKKDVEGIAPILMKKLYSQRKQHKKELQKLSKIENKTEKIKDEIKQLDNLQWVEKIILNSFYGAFLNKYFRFFDQEIGEAITLTGQTIVRTAEKELNKYLNAVLKTENKEYVFYVDTDSNYINCDDIVNKFKEKYPNASKKEIVDFLDVFFKKKIEPELTRIFSELAHYMNAKENCIVMKREVIGESGMWLKKKKYAMKIWDNEGFRYENPKLKVKGIQTVRSDTPKAIIKYLQNALNILLDGGDIKTYVKETEREILKMDINDIAITKSVNDIAKYQKIENGKRVYTKGAPLQVKAAILHNNLVDKFDLKGKLNYINSGDKIKYLYLTNPNPLEEEVICFVGKLPEKFNLHNYIDKQTQCQKIFIKIIEDMCKQLNINFKKSLF